MNDLEKNDTPLTDIEKNRQIALNDVRLNIVPNEPRVIDTFRGPIIKHPDGRSQKVLTYVVHENHCCFAFQPFAKDKTPNAATPLGFNEPDFKKNFEILKKMYAQKAAKYAATLNSQNGKIQS